MKVPIGQIKIKKRIRKNSGNLQSLKQSLQKYGLLNPVIINSKRELIAGHRRLEAARLLGWEDIEAVAIEKDDRVTKLELEIEENIQRMNLTPEEIAEANRRLKKLKNPGLGRKILIAIVSFLKRFFHRG